MFLSQGKNALDKGKWDTLDNRLSLMVYGNYEDVDDDVDMTTATVTIRLTAMMWIQDTIGTMTKKLTKESRTKTTVKSTMSLSC